MTEQRQKLLDRFDKWLDSKPRKQIISAQCANIAEEYAEEQLLLHNVSQQRELLLAYHRYLTEELSLDLHEVWVDEHLKANNCG